MKDYLLQCVVANMNNASYTLDKHYDGNTPSVWTRASVTITNSETTVTINFAGLVMGDTRINPIIDAELEDVVETFMSSFEV